KKDTRKISKTVWANKKQTVIKADYAVNSLQLTVDSWLRRHLRCFNVQRTTDNEQWLRLYAVNSLQLEVDS
ncbi:MAG: hypothetical protein QMB54_06680, partial [Neofamilia sp.]